MWIISKKVGDDPGFKGASEMLGNYQEIKVWGISHIMSFENTTLNPKILESLTPFSPLVGKRT
jgi:hypothetical protein